MENISKLMQGANEENTPRDLNNFACVQGSSSHSERADSNASYLSWVKKHPSALSAFDDMMEATKGKELVVFLDYDGTLSPLVEDPNRAFMSDKMRSAVREVAQCFPTCIISGRSRDKVYQFVNLTGVYYAGSHGMDIMVPMQPLTTSNSKCQTRLPDEHGIEGVPFQPAKEFLPTIQKIIAALEETTKNIHGVMIENNRFCVSVHFRRVHDKDFSTLEAQVKSILQGYEGFHLTRGKKVMEIRPSIKWDKGDAVEYLLEALGFGNNKQVVPIYIGDDQTDEDAFKILREKEQGYPIVVSSTPKKTSASYSLQDPSEVLCFLIRLARWRKNALSGASSVA